MQSQSKAGRSLLLILLALGVTSGCGGATLPEDTDTSAPELEVITQAEFTLPFDGPVFGRPRLLGSCNEQQTKDGFIFIDQQWDEALRLMRTQIACKAYYRQLPLRRNDLALYNHVWKGLFGAGCLSRQGTESQESACSEWNSYRSDLQLQLLVEMGEMAKAGRFLSPSGIFALAMEASGDDPALALWTAYRVTNVLAGKEGVEQYPKTVGAMLNMRSPCSPFTDLRNRSGIHYHFFLLALISYNHGVVGGSLGTIIERYASISTAKEDSDKAAANWAGVAMGAQFELFRRLGARGSGGVSASSCKRANMDSAKVIIGEPATLVALFPNDKVTPKSLRNQLTASIFGVDPGLTVSPVSEPGVVNVSSSGPPKTLRFSYFFTDSGNEKSNTAPVMVDVQCPASKPDWDPAVSQCTARCGDCEGVKHCDTGSGTPTCKCPPENPDWNPTTQKCEPPLTCGGGSTASGGDEGYSKTLELGATSGTLSLSFQTYTQKDRLRVMYGGATLIDTGCVGASGTLSAAYSGTSTQATMVVEPNCEGGSGTAWDFSFGCAR